MKSKVLCSLLVTGLLLLFSMTAIAGGLPKPISTVAEAQKLIDKAWALERTDNTAEIYKQCASLLEQADKLDPNNHMILTDLARYYWSWGDNLPKATPEQQKFLVELYKKGLAAAEKSLKIKETVGGHYWYAVNKAASLEFSSIAAQAAGFPVIYKHYQYVAKNDPDYYYGANGRLWAEILSRVPKQVVKMVGWDVQEAVAEIDRSIKVEPRYFDNYVYKARFLYIYFGNKDEALKLIEHVLKQNPNIFPEEVTANKASQRAGRELWKKITGKDYPQR